MFLGFHEDTLSSVVLLNATALDVDILRKCQEDLVSQTNIVLAPAFFYSTFRFGLLLLMELSVLLDRLLIGLKWRSGKNSISCKTRTSLFYLLYDLYTRLFLILLDHLPENGGTILDLRW